LLYKNTDKILNNKWFILFQQTLVNNPKIEGDKNLIVFTQVAGIHAEEIKTNGIGF
jgi:hypothetical protein